MRSTGAGDDVDGLVARTPATSEVSSHAENWIAYAEIVTGVTAPSNCAVPIAR